MKPPVTFAFARAAGLFAFFALVALAAGLAPAAGDDADAAGRGKLSVGEAYAFASIGNAPTGAVFLTLRNEGRTAETLLGAASDFAARMEIHTHKQQNGRMMMRPVSQIGIPPGKSVTLAPGGLHLMLMGLSAPLKAGETRRLELIFEKAGRVPVDVVIRARGGVGNGGGNGGGGG